MMAENAIDGAMPGEWDRRLALALDVFTAGQIAEAADMIQDLLSLRPGDAGALSLRALVLQSGEDLGGTVRAMREAVRLDETAVRRAHLGNLLARLGRHAEALDSHERALALDSDNPEILNSVGQCLVALKRREEAVDAFRRAVARRPEFAEAWINLGYALGCMGRGPEADEAYEAALETDPPVDAPCRATALLGLGRFSEAATVGRRSVRRWPDDPGAHAALASALRAVGDLAGAEAAARRVIAFRPDDVVALNNFAILLQERGRFSEALSVLDRAEAIAPADPETKHHKVITLLLQGRWTEAWPLYDWRLYVDQTRGVHQRFVAEQPWRGEPVAGRTVLVMPEQGAGDMIHVVRYVPLLAARGARVVLVTVPALRRLFASVPGVDLLVTADDGEPAHDLYCWMMSLPGLFGATPTSVPASVPYLTVDGGLSTRWRTRIGAARAGSRVGIVWAGNPAHLNDRRRSIAFDALASLWSVAGVSWFSLQVGPRAGDLAGAPVAVDDLAPDIGDFADTAAAIEALDLVVAVDTAVAHIAGALGKAVWLMLPAQVDWRWGLSGDTTPWYPTMRLFRRGQDEGWAPTVTAVARALRAWAASTPRDDGTGVAAR